MDFFISDWLGIVLFHHLPFHTLAHKMQHQQSKFSSLFYHFETVCPSGLSAAPGPDSGWNWKYCRESVISELYWNCFMYSNSIPGCHDEWMKRWVHNNTSGTTSRWWGGEGEVGGENAKCDASRSRLVPKAPVLTASTFSSSSSSSTKTTLRHGNYHYRARTRWWWCAAAAEKCKTKAVLFFDWLLILLFVGGSKVGPAGTT